MKYIMFFSLFFSLLTVLYGKDDLSTLKVNLKLKGININTIDSKSKLYYSPPEYIFPSKEKVLVSNLKKEKKLNLSSDKKYIELKNDNDNNNLSDDNYELNTKYETSQSNKKVASSNNYLLWTILAVVALGATVGTVYLLNQEDEPKSTTNYSGTW